MAIVGLTPNTVYYVHLDDQFLLSYLMSVQLSTTYCGAVTKSSANKRPLARKLAAWTPCHQGDRMPSAKPAGTCQPISAATGASQQTTGWVTTRRSELARGQRRAGASLALRENQQQC